MNSPVSIDGISSTLNMKPPGSKTQSKINHEESELKQWIDDGEDKKKNWNSTSVNKEYQAYKGMGLPVRGVFFLYDRDIAFCNDNELVFLDVELEKKPAIVPAGNTETCNFHA